MSAGGNSVCLKCFDAHQSHVGICVTQIPMIGKGLQGRYLQQPCCQMWGMSAKAHWMMTVFRRCKAAGAPAIVMHAASLVHVNSYGVRPGLAVQRTFVRQVRWLWCNVGSSTKLLVVVWLSQRTA